MQVHVFDTERQAGQAAALLIAEQLLSRPKPTLGLATGSTPIPAYQELVRLTQTGLLDWHRATTFNLDEYIGLAGDHPQSFRAFMMRQLFDQVNIRPQAIHVPDGLAADPERACLAYEQAIRAAGGIDLQLLGLGRNGHIGFNEPARTFSTRTQVVDLTEDTIDANARFFDRAADVPRQAISMGIGTIMQARKVLLLVTGAAKARAVRQVLCDPVDPACPGSIIQLHQQVVVLLDRPAATALSQC